MSKRGYRQYGQGFLSSYNSLWPWPLWVFHDGWEPPNSGLGYRFFDLDKYDPEAARFWKDYSECENPTDYREQPVKFSRKVFAITSSIQITDWLIWIDADVTFHKAPDDDFIRGVLPRDKAISFLGRPWFAHSETGFMAFNLSSPPVIDMLFDMRLCYAKRPPPVMSLPQKHDSMVFDLCLRRSKIPVEQRNDLVDPKISEGKLHVWPDTLLEGYCSHHKGPKRKRALSDA